MRATHFIEIMRFHAGYEIEDDNGSHTGLPLRRQFSTLLNLIRRLGLVALQ